MNPTFLVIDTCDAQNIEITKSQISSMQTLIIDEDRHLILILSLDTTQMPGRAS